MSRGALGVLIGVSLLGGCVTPSTHRSAFLVIDALALPSHQRQPTFIALYAGHREIVHVPTGGELVELPAGGYRIVHIDFGKDPSSGSGTISLGRSKALYFELKADTIAYFGMLQLEKRRPGTEVVVHADVELLGRACRSNGSAFAEFPMYLINWSPAENVVACSVIGPDPGMFGKAR